MCFTAFNDRPPLPSLPDQPQPPILPQSAHDLLPPRVVGGQQQQQQLSGQPGSLMYGSGVVDCRITRALLLSLAVSELRCTAEAPDAAESVRGYCVYQMMGLLARLQPGGGGGGGVSIDEYLRDKFDGKGGRTEGARRGSAGSKLKLGGGGGGGGGARPPTSLY